MSNIKEAEEQTGISRANIRYYEKMGLLQPKRNEKNGYREYRPEDIKRILQIKILRKLDVPIERSGILLITGNVWQCNTKTERETGKAESRTDGCN